MLRYSDWPARWLPRASGEAAPFSRGEDAMVVELVKKAHLLEREMKRLQLDQRRVIPLKHDEADET